MHPLGRVRIPRNGPHRAEDIRASIVRQPHQVPHQRPERFAYVRLTHIKLVQRDANNHRRVFAAGDSKLRNISSATVCCERVRVPAATSRENRKPAYYPVKVLAGSCTRPFPVGCPRRGRGMTTCVCLLGSS